MINGFLSKYIKKDIKKRFVSLFILLLIIPLILSEISTYYVTKSILTDNTLNSMEIIINSKDNEVNKYFEYNQLLLDSLANNRRIIDSLYSIKVHRELIIMNNEGKTTGIDKAKEYLTNEINSLKHPFVGRIEVYDEREILVSTGSDEDVYYISKNIIYPETKEKIGSMKLGIKWDELKDIINQDFYETGKILFIKNKDLSENIEPQKRCLESRDMKGSFWIGLKGYLGASKCHNDYLIYSQIEKGEISTKMNPLKSINLAILFTMVIIYFFISLKMIKKYINILT